MANNSLTMVVAQVKLGNLEFEGLMNTEGEFFVGFPQLQALNLVPPNRSQKQLESLLGMCFQSHQKARTRLNSKAVNVISLLEFEKVLVALDRKGNIIAQSMRDDLVGLSLTQLFNDAFNIEFGKQERQNWLKNRATGIIARRTLTDSIKDWYERNPGVTSRPYCAMFSVTTNAIYQALWGMDASQLEKTLSCGKTESRDYMDADSLKYLEYAEARVSEFIDDDIKPNDAVLTANIKPRKVPTVNPVITDKGVK
jgi:hypothetical protein